MSVSSRVCVPKRRQLLVNAILCLSKNASSSEVNDSFDPIFSEFSSCIFTSSASLLWTSQSTKLLKEGTPYNNDSDDGGNSVHYNDENKKNEDQRKQAEGEVPIVDLVCKTEKNNYNVNNQDKDNKVEEYSVDDELNHHENEEEKSSVSLNYSLTTPPPLLLACDKAQSEVLFYYQRMLFQLKKLLLQQQKSKQFINSHDELDDTSKIVTLQTCYDDFKYIWGDPLDSLPNGNTALHHAASSGCVAALYVLVNLLIIQRSNNDENYLLVIDAFNYENKDNNGNDIININSSSIPNGNDNKYIYNMNKEFTHTLEQLLQSRNEHGDTPLMMASVNGNVTFVRTAITKMCSVMIKSTSIDGDGNCHPLLEQNSKKCQFLLLQDLNHSKHSVLSLAVGNGHESIIKYLISTSKTNNEKHLIQITTDHLIHCQQTIPILDQLVKLQHGNKQTQNSMLKKIRQRKQQEKYGTQKELNDSYDKNNQSSDVNSNDNYEYILNCIANCYKLLERHVGESAEATMKELLLLEEHDVCAKQLKKSRQKQQESSRFTTNGNNGEKKSAKKKKKKKGNNNDEKFQFEKTAEDKGRFVLSTPPLLLSATTMEETTINKVAITDAEFEKTEEMGRDTLMDIGATANTNSHREVPPINTQNDTENERKKWLKVKIDDTNDAITSRQNFGDGNNHDKKVLGDNYEKHKDGSRTMISNNVDNGYDNDNNNNSKRNSSNMHCNLKNSNASNINSNVHGELLPNIDDSNNDSIKTSEGSRQNEHSTNYDNNQSSNHQHQEQAAQQQSHCYHCHHRKPDDSYYYDALDSLCLKVDDLIKSSQRMALEYSPGQIDGIEAVLIQQLEAVNQARQLQKKWREKHSSSDFTAAIPAAGVIKASTNLDKGGNLHDKNEYTGSCTTVPVTATTIITANSASTTATATNAMANACASFNTSDATTATADNTKKTIPLVEN